MPDHHHTQAHVLLIKDNREVRLAARFVLDDWGYQITEPANPVQAREWLNTQQAELLLLDMSFQLDTTSGEAGLRFLGY